MAWTFGDFNLDPERFELSRSGESVRLEPQVLALLIHLVRRRDVLVSKDEIVAAVWQGTAVSDASISSRVRSARAAIGDDGARQELIRTVHGRGFRFVGEVTNVPLSALSRTGTLETTHSDGRPTIAVLPLQPLGLSSELAIFGEAIPHEIIRALSRLRWLAVIARGSSFRFPRVPPDLKLVAKALSARYVLAGILESPACDVAVTLELTDTSSREVIWANRLTCPLDGIYDLREEIVAQLISALEIHIPSNEARLARLGRPEGLDAWANYHLGLSHLYRFTMVDTCIAQELFERALALDPQFARASAGLSFTSFIHAFLRLGPDPAASAIAARRHAEHSLELDALDPFANFTMGRSFWLTDEPEIAAGWLARATALNPNYAQGFYASAFTAMLTGDAPATFAALDTSYRLSPLDPLLYGVYGVRAQLLLQQKDDQAAAHWANRAATSPGAHYLIAMIALVANGLAGQHDQAAHWAEEVKRLRPQASAADYFRAFPTRDAESRKRIAVELRAQGF